MSAGSTVELLTTDVTARTQWRVVRISYPDGRCGLGEASDSGPLAEAVTVLADLTSALGPIVDQHALPAEAVRAWADDAIGRLPDSRFARTVLGGVEQALCDLFATDNSQPVHAWLRPGHDHVTREHTVTCYANINRVPGGRAPADVARAATAAVAAGFRAVKCAPFDRPHEDLPLAEAGLQRVRAVREAIGPDVDLLVDCHLRLTVDEVLTIAPALQELGVSWLEDAAETPDLDALRRLREHSGLRLAGGEFSHHPAQFAAAVEAGLLDVLLLDVKHAGGITRALQLADTARAAGAVAISPHNPTGPVGTAASVHFLLAAPGADVLELAVGEVDWRAEMTRPAEHVAAGRLSVTDGPGLGVGLSDRQSGVSVAWSSRAEVTS